MNQEGLNFEILNRIQDRLTPHMASLNILGHLIANSAESDFIEDDIAFGLSTFLYEWIDLHNSIIEDTLTEVKEQPEYVLYEAADIVNSIPKGASIEAERIQNLIERLENVIEVYGDWHRSEAEPLLEKLKGVLEKKQIKQ